MSIVYYKTYTLKNGDFVRRPSRKYKRRPNKIDLIPKEIKKYVKNNYGKKLKKEICRETGLSLYLVNKINLR